MASKRRLEEVHFVCRRGHRVEEQNDGTFRTSSWVIKPEHIREGLVFALHDAHAEPSYLQGEVIGLIKVIDDRKPSGRRLRRVELHVRKTPGALPWRGTGTREKSFVWS
ncbi:MAG: hypothetical protein DMF61_05730 [Blastocatellia bacterium AA13]|nr:MAG: hypothetical protein DMF61_05730 [Blastocatellia bacterium AA13]